MAQRWGSNRYVVERERLVVLTPLQRQERRPLSGWFVVGACLNGVSVLIGGGALSAASVESRAVDWTGGLMSSAYAFALLALLCSFAARRAWSFSRFEDAAAWEVDPVTAQWPNPRPLDTLPSGHRHAS